jgi:thiamine pyrophosphate-dependent acetolactate synthase large subunit-like protein
MAKPITKACFQISDPDTIPIILSKRLRLLWKEGQAQFLSIYSMDVQRFQLSQNIFSEKAENFEIDL